MFKLVVLSALVACALGAAIPDGLLPQLDGRIVGGVETDIGKYPYQVSLQKSGSHICGGSIFSDKVIVTAAHCLQSTAASTLKVRAGSTYRSSGGSLVNVASFTYNSGYNAATMVNDIAVVRLSSALPLGTNIKVIALVSSAPAAGTAATVTGWGTTSSGGTSYDRLRYVDVKIVSQSQCSSSTYGYGSEIKATMICAAASGKDACQGDSGGPLVTSAGQVGVVSWGYGCAASNYPGVYSDVAALRTWVYNNA